MDKMSVLELFQCFFWGIGGTLPLALAAFTNILFREESEGTVVCILVTVMMQTAIILAAFKAGSK